MSGIENHKGEIMVDVQPLKEQTAAEVKKKEPSTPMSYSAKLCLSTTFGAVVLAVLFAVGVFDRFLPLLNYMVTERPLSAAIISTSVVGFVSYVVSTLLPLKVRDIANFPVLAIIAYWLGTLWHNTLDGRTLEAGATLSPSGLVAILAALLALCVCITYHDTSLKQGEKKLFFSYGFAAFNVLAFIAVYLLNSMIADTHAAARHAVDSQIEVYVRVTEVMGAACPYAYSKDYCDKVQQVVDSPEFKRSWR